MSNINSSASIIGTAGDPSNFPIRITARDGSLLSWVDENGFLGGNFKVGTGGSGTPGGSNQQIQYNNNGVFDGLSAFTWDGTNLIAVVPDPGQIAFAAGPNTGNFIQIQNNGIVISAGETGSSLSVSADSGIAFTTPGPYNIQGDSINIVANSMSFFNANTPIAQPTVTGSTTTDLTALQATARNLLTALANLGLIVDGTT